MREAAELLGMGNLDGSAELANKSSHRKRETDRLQMDVGDTSRFASLRFSLWWTMEEIWCPFRKTIRILCVTEVNALRRLTRECVIAAIRR